MTIAAPLRMTLAFAGAVALLVVAYWTLGFLTQRSAMFPAPPAGPVAVPAGATQAWLQTSAGRVEAWYLPPARATGRAPLLIFTHGNAELIDYWPAEFTEPRAWGIGVLLVEYPGYGRSEGRPSERSITEAVTTAFDWAAAQPTVDPARIVAYGRSIGGGAAGALARSRPIAALVLESSFSSVGALAVRYGYPPFLARDKFDVRSAVRAFRGPVLVIHGEQDGIIPVSHGRALHAAAANATLELMRCGHNDCPRPWPALRRFLRAHHIEPGAGAP